MPGKHQRQPYAADSLLLEQVERLQGELWQVQRMLGMEELHATSVRLWMERHIAVLVRTELNDRQREAFDAGAEAMRELILHSIGHRFPHVRTLSVKTLEGRP